MTNYRARFMANNFIDSTVSYTYSSQASATYAISNTLNQARSKAARFGGNFTVTALNNLIYINDGSNKTATLTAGNYTYATLATHVQTQLNAVSSLWTCTYDFSGGTFKFTIAHTGSATLRLTQTSTAAWDMLGYTGVADRTGTSFVADEQRNHTEEWIRYDFLLAQTVTFFAAVGRIDRAFGLSAGAVVRVQANNVDSWTAPTLDVTVTAGDRGLFRFFDDIADTAFRYWRFKIVDRLNTCGPTGFEVGHVYIGDYETFTTTNISTGYQRTRVDPSSSQESQSGVRYFLKRPTYRVFQSMSVEQIPDADRVVMESLYESVGQTTSFYFSLDPTLVLTSDLSDMTAYVNFASDLQISNVWRNYFMMNFELREAV